MDQPENRRNPSRAFACGLLLLGGLFTFTGCGGDETKQPVAPLPKPKPKAAIPVANATQGSPSKPGGLPKAAKNSQEPLNPEADPADVFQIVPPTGNPYNSNDMFAIVPSESNRNEVAVILPGQDVSADSFHVVKRGEQPTPSHRPHPKLKMPRGFEIVEEAGYNETGLPWRIRSVPDGAEMVLVPHGPARIGSHQGPSNTQPELTVELKPFYMDVTEVTVGQYEKFLEATKDDRRVRVRIQSVEESLPKEAPMTGIPWGDAVTYLKWVGKTLPTEAQWEKAARGERGFPHAWGHEDAIWFQKRTREQITPVRTYPNDKSPYGIFDLAGNAREWCADWYRPDSFAEVKAQEKTLADWEGPKSAEPEFARVVKGNGPDWNLWHRSGVSMREESSTIGFRGVLTVTDFPLDEATTQTTSNNR